MEKSYDAPWYGAFLKWNVWNQYVLKEFIAPFLFFSGILTCLLTTFQVTNDYFNRKSGLLEEIENTIIAFTADNGTNTSITSKWNGRQITGGKGGMTDMGTHVPPLILHIAARTASWQADKSCRAYPILA